MIKGIFKLAVAAVIANALWHAFVPYAAYFKFKDAVEATSLYGYEKPDDELRAKIMDLASDHDVPLTPEGLTLKRELKHTIIDGSYTQHIELFPGFKYPYTFTLHIDTVYIQPPKLSDLAAPK